GVGGGGGAGVAGGDGCLEDVGAGLGGELLGVCEGGEAAADEEAVPARAVLVEEEDGFTGGGDAGGEAGGPGSPEGDEAVDFGLGGGEFGEDAAEAEGVLAEGGSGPVVACGGGVALVEDEVDDLEDGGEAGVELVAVGELEGDFCFGEGSFGSNDTL